MKLSKYQDMASIYAKPECRTLVNAALGLAGESGEFVELVKKDQFHGVPLDKTKAVKELGDVLWYVALAATVLGVSLDDVASQNIEKLQARYPSGFVKGGGVR